MELMFNELSLKPICSSVEEAKICAHDFAKTYAAAGRAGFLRVRSVYRTSEVQLAPEYSFHDWLMDGSVPKVQREQFYGKWTHPFIDEDDEERSEKYITSDYYFEDKESKLERQKCFGLTAAHLFQTLSISVATAELWKRIKLNVIVVNEEGELVVPVFNVASPESFNDERVSKFIENLGEVELIETDIAPKDKEVGISDHHGKKELNELAARMIHSPYVEIIRSTRWGGNRFVRKVEPTGVIEIVLVNSQRRYALWVQTTGRNYRETLEISKLLADRYE